jgi:hypothetical protein
MTDYIGKINNYPIGGKNFDGKPVIFTTDQSGLIIGAGTAPAHNLLFDIVTIPSNGHVTYSVADIIPNDGYDYELFLSSYLRTVATSGKSIQVCVGSGTLTSDTGALPLIRTLMTRTNAVYYSQNNAWLPIKASDKNITFFNLGNSNASVDCRINGYRRIGTNGKTSSNILSNIDAGIEVEGRGWTTPKAVGTNKWHGVTYGNGKFVAVGYSGYTTTSTDGVTWTTPKVVGSSAWYSATYANGKFVAVGDSGYTTTYELTTTKIPFGGKNFDGQWTLKLAYMTPSTGTTYANATATTYSLADYLPDDGCDYMVAFSSWGATPSGKGTFSEALICGTQDYTTTYNYGVCVVLATYHSTSYYTGAGNTMLPIFANDRNVTIKVDCGGNYTSGNCGLYALAYRRIGTNE